MNLKNKKVVAASVTALVLLVAALFLLNSRSKISENGGGGEDLLPTSQVLPTIDSSVQVSVLANKKKTEVNLTVSAIPKGVVDIEYEFSYIAEGDIPKGVLGTIPIDGASYVERKITLGTCSSGTCVYDNGVEKVKVSLKFNAPSGASIFEKEFAI